MSRDAFWLQQCPQRGVDLTHMWDGAKASGPEGICVHCGKLPGDVDAQARLESLGLSDPLPADAIMGEPPETIIPEPRFITGIGPQGDPKGPGRGFLTPKLMAYLDLLHTLWLVGRA